MLAVLLFGLPSRLSKTKKDRLDNALFQAVKSVPELRVKSRDSLPIMEVASVNLNSKVHHIVVMCLYHDHERGPEEVGAQDIRETGEKIAETIRQHIPHAQAQVWFEHWDPYKSRKKRDYTMISAVVPQVTRAMLEAQSVTPPQKWHRRDGHNRGRDTDNRSRDGKRPRDKNGRK